MKNYISLMSMMLGLLVLCSMGSLKGEAFVGSSSGTVSISGPEWVPDELLIKLKPAVARDGMKRTGFFAQHGLSEAQPVIPMKSARHGQTARGLERLYKVKLSSGEEPAKRAAALNALDEVEYAEPNLIMRAQVPNDPLYLSSGSWGRPGRDMWGLLKIQLTEMGSGTSGWDITTGSDSPIIVAVIDTGVDFDHPDLADNIYVNPHEIPDNGIDDDGNGYIDDVQGWNFVDNNNRPHDGHGHGTHCAGTIAALTDNSIGVAGICWGARIMPLKGLSDSGSGAIDGLVAALVYAADNGAHIISNSWGGMGTSDALEDAVNYAVDAGCLVVAAAGNNSVNVEDFQFIPAAYPGTLCVAALDRDDTAAWFTNFGKTVDVSAPGVDILSLRAAGTDMYGTGTHIIQEHYYYANGTSMACPHAAGLAALVMTANPTWSATEVSNQLRHTADFIDHLNPDYIGQLGTGRINAYRALTVVPGPDLVVIDVWGVKPGNMAVNGAVDPGETSELELLIQNRWRDASQVAVELFSNDPLAVVQPGVVPVGDIPAGAVTTVRGFQLTVDPETPYGHRLALELYATAQGGYAATLPVTLSVNEPRVFVKSSRVVELIGNDNGLLEPGERAQLEITLANRSGSAPAVNLLGTLSSPDSRVSILQPEAEYTRLDPGDSMTNTTTPFVVELDVDYPIASTVVLDMTLTADHDYAVSHRMEFSMPNTFRTFWNLQVPGWPPISFSQVSANVGPDNTIHVALENMQSSYSTIRYTRWGGGFWSSVEEVTPPSAALQSQNVVGNLDGTAQLAWLESRLVPGWTTVPLFMKEMFYSHGGPPWSTRYGITQKWEVEALREGNLAVDTAGRVHLVWRWMDWSVPNESRWYHKYYENGAWTEPTVVYATADTNRCYWSLKLTPGPDNTLWFTWIRCAVYGEPGAWIQGTHWDGQAWGPTELMIQGSDDMIKYQFAVDRTGHLHALMTTSGPSQLVYAHSDNGLVWSPAETISSGGASAYSLFADTDGRLYCAWVQSNVFYQRIRYQDIWSAQEVLHTQQPAGNYRYGGLFLMTDGSGNRHLLWDEIRDSSFCAVNHLLLEPVVRKLDPTATPTHTNTPLPMATNTPTDIPTNTVTPTMTPTETGPNMTATVTWLLDRPGDADRDLFVNANDYRIVRDYFGQARWDIGDANADGFVNAEDYRAVRDNFGRAYQP